MSREVKLNKVNDIAQSGGRWHLTRKVTRRLLLGLAALLAVGLLMFTRLDMGPAAREYAEHRATEYLERPMHIGKLIALPWPGRFELDNVVIEGVDNADQPFLSAQRIVVDLNWRTLLHFSKRELFVDVMMSDWKMAIETYPGDRPSSLPKIMPKNPPSGGPGPFSTTVRVVAQRGQFTYIDHATPWSVIAPNLSFDLVRAENLNAYVGTASFHGGVVQIQSYQPMAAALTTRFTLDTEHGRVAQIGRVHV